MSPAQIIERLDLVDPDDPVLAGKSLFERAQLRALSWELLSPHSVHRLAGREKRVVVVVAHLVHEAVFHGLRGIVVDFVFTTRGEVVALFNFVGPDACQTC